MSARGWDGPGMPWWVVFLKQRGGSGEESRCEPAASHWPSALDFFGADFLGRWEEKGKRKW